MKKIILLLCFFTLSNLSMSQEKMSNEMIMQKVSKGKPFTLVFLKSTGSKPKEGDNVQQIQMDHLANLFQLEKAGKISIFGPINNDPTLAGIIVFNSSDKGAVKKEMDNDPFVKSGLMKFEMVDFFTIPGQKIPE